MTLSLLSLPSLTTVYAAESPCYSTLNAFEVGEYKYWKLIPNTNPAEYEKIPCQNHGYYIAPDKPGMYPVLFLFHGTGGIDDYKNNIISTMNRWVELGLIEPMVVIMVDMPKVGDPSGSVEDTRNYIANGEFKKLLDKVKNGTFECSDKIDTSRYISAAGYSLGACAALFVGQKYPDDIVNICAASPATMFYMGEGQWGWVNYAKDIRFSQNPDAHFVTGYGQAEKDPFGTHADRYVNAFENNKSTDPDYNANSFQYYTSYHEGHTWNTFKREIFAFLYYVNTDKMPTDEIVENACTNSNNTSQNPSGENTNNQTSQNGEENKNTSITTPTGDQVEATPEATDNKDSNSNNANNATNSNTENSGTTTSEPDFQNSTHNNPQYSNEWINGHWYNADGTSTYNGVATWRCNAQGWWLEDSTGWYPTSTWQKIDGYWYYFETDGYMASNEWIGGYWLSGSGALTYAETATWKQYGTKWSYIDTSGWYPTSMWQKINSNWYYFDSSGYIVTNKKVDGYWLDSDGICN